MSTLALLSLLSGLTHAVPLGTAFACQGRPRARTGSRLTVSNGATLAFDILSSARSRANGHSAASPLRAAIENVQRNTCLVGTPVITILAEDVPAWDATVREANEQDALSIQVTAAAGSTVRWVAPVQTAQVTC